LRQFLDRPGLRAAGEIFDHRDDRVGLDLLDEIGRRILAEIDAAPARHEHQRAIV
jgi:hypothetical protein